MQLAYRKYVHTTESKCEIVYFRYPHRKKSLIATLHFNCWRGRMRFRFWFGGRHVLRVSASCIQG